MTVKYAQPDPIGISNREWPSRRLGKSPAWCAVDLRDGNQALPNPMTPVQKKRYFQLLVDIGFKEIEIGFPSASADDFQFCRDLIEEGLIPDDVTISVLTQAREHLIKRTMEALRGVKKALVHVYIATSDLHMKFVFNKTREETSEIAVKATRLIREEARKMKGSQVGLQFSPEEFTDTDLAFAVDICNDVMDAWQPEGNEKVILNLPATVERRPPNEYADMIELFCRRVKDRENAIISVHSHNDMGCAVAASEMTLLAGADRVEGTMFGHGERSGNVDLMVLALNLQYMGIDTGLKFDNLTAIRDKIVELTSMSVHARHPYAGELVFTAFSGSHQDAIHKGLTRRRDLVRQFGAWKIPYLHIDPADLGRSYEKFIRINSQSGKGGIAHILEAEYGVRLPRPLLIDFSHYVQQLADQSSREIDAPQLWELFKKSYVHKEGLLEAVKYWPRPNPDDPAQIDGEAHVICESTPQKVSASGQGPISAFVKALRKLPIPDFNLEYYEEDAMGKSAEAEAVAFVRLNDGQDNSAFGVGFGPNIDQAAVQAIVSALNVLFGE
ncbi:MAG: 2-isopropylmalate synthase [Lentisphaeria bacterium]